MNQVIQVPNVIKVGLHSFLSFSSLVELSDVEENVVDPEYQHDDTCSCVQKCWIGLTFWLNHPLDGKVHEANREGSVEAKWSEHPVEQVFLVMVPELL